MSRKKINWSKIFANSLEMFFGSLTGALLVNSQLPEPLSFINVLLIAAGPAAIQFGLTFAHEWGQEEGGSADKNPASKKYKTKTSQITLKHLKLRKILAALVIRE